MQLIKSLLFATSLIICSASHASIKIRFLNGIQNSAKDMEDSRVALFEAYQLYRTPAMPKLVNSDFSGYPNPKDDWVIGDDIELSIQGTISGVAQQYAQIELDLKIAKAKNTGLQISDAVISQWYQAIYQRTLTEYYANYLAISKSNGRVNISGVINDTLAKIRSDLADGSSVVIVSHSQGNLFAEAINTQLTTLEKSRIRFVGVASVASSTPNNRYRRIQARSARNID